MRATVVRPWTDDYVNLFGSLQRSMFDTPELQALDDSLPGTLINDPSALNWSTFGTIMKSKIVKSAEIPGGAENFADFVHFTDAGAQRMATLVADTLTDTIRRGQVRPQVVASVAVPQ